MLSHLKIGQNRNKEYIKKPNEKERKKNETIKNDKKNKINEWEWKKYDEINDKLSIMMILSWYNKYLIVVFFHPFQ